MKSLAAEMEMTTKFSRTLTQTAQRTKIRWVGRQTLRFWGGNYGRKRGNFVVLPHGTGDGVVHNRGRVCCTREGGGGDNEPATSLTVYVTERGRTRGAGAER